MRFDMVRVQLDETGHQIVALEIDRSSCSFPVPFRNVADATVPHMHRALDHGVGQHDAGIRDGEFGHGIVRFAAA